MEWRRLKDEECSGCGLPKAQTFDPANHDAYRARPLTCFACAERDRATKLFTDSPNAETAGLFFAVHRT